MIQIKNTRETNELLKALFPDVLYQNPKKESLKWREDKICVKWQSTRKKMTVEEISKKISLQFPFINMYKIKKDIIPSYNLLRELLSMNETEKIPQHLAVLVQPFLDLILEGKKTIETRFTRVKCPPFQQVKEGDVILLKKSGGLVLGEMTAGKVEYFSNMTSERINELKKYSSQICSEYDPEFWDKRKDCRYVSFIHVENVKKYEKPYAYPKSDRRAWIVLNRSSDSQPNLFNIFRSQKERE